MNGTYEIDYEDGDQDSDVDINRLIKYSWESEDDDDDDDEEDWHADEDDGMNDDDEDCTTDDLRKMMKMTLTEKSKRQDEVHAQWLATKLRAADKAAAARP